MGSGKNSLILIGSVVAGAIIVVLSFQNCGGGFQTYDSLGNATNNLQQSTGSGTTSTGTGGGTTTTGTGGGSSPTASGACILSPTTTLSGVVTGITVPNIQSSYAILTGISEGTINETSLGLVASSFCFTTAEFTTAQPCPTGSPSPTPTPACQPVVMVEIGAVCSETSSTATTCSSAFTNLVGASTNVSAAPEGLSFAVTVTTCNPTGSTSYLPPITGSKTGTFTINTLGALGAGQNFSVTLNGVGMIQNGTTAADAITVSGTFAGQIVSIPACTK